MRRSYEWLMDFIAAALGKERPHHYADPMGALNLAVMGDGDQLHWHYDQADFVSSIALRFSPTAASRASPPAPRAAARSRALTLGLN